MDTIKYCKCAECGKKKCTMKMRGREICLDCWLKEDFYKD
jgi:hypothetical protein